MNYQLIYDQIIARAQLRVLDLSTHYDRHHIVPRSMGGTNDSTNLVSLTDKEHFIVHVLLWKIHRNKQMTAALWIMSQNKRYRYKEMNSNRYAELREEFRRNQTNNQIYKFENIITGEIFEGSRAQFRKYANITYAECATIVKNGSICFVSEKFNTNGINWKLYGSSIAKRIPHNTDSTLYEFENVYTGAEFIGTRKQFDNEISYRSYEVVNRIRIVNGWKLKSAIFKKIPKNKDNTNIALQGNK